MERKKIKCSENTSLRFLYRTFFGRIILKFLTLRFVSRVCGAFLNTRASKLLIKGFIKRNKIDMSQYEEREFTSYNDFFTRKIKDGARRFDENPAHLCAPCDSKLSAYVIGKNSVFTVKGAPYSILDLLGGNEQLANRYNGGICLVFRLGVDDYHRYYYVDSGICSQNVFIKGVLHTVQPIAFEKYNVYKRNCREYSTMQSENFGLITYVEVGALLVGKIKNPHNGGSHLRYDEKGMFEFGGSTVVLLLEKGCADIDADILENTESGYETAVLLGEKIGRRSDI